MGGIVLSPNPTRTKAQININGDEVKPFTKEVIKKVEVPYQPTKEEVVSLAARPPQEPAKSNPFADIMKDALKQQMVEAMKELDMKSMMQEIMKDLFKK